MKNAILFVAIVVMMIAATSCQPGGTPDVKLETRVDSASYAIGVLVGANNKKQLEGAPGGSTMNLEAMAQAFRSASLGEEVKISEEDANAFIQKFFIV